jgi:predicted nuclease with TOPRIM domain
MVEINDHSLIQTVSLVALAVVAFSVGIQKLLKDWKSTHAETSVITLMHTELERMSEQNGLLSTELNRLQQEMIVLNTQLSQLCVENQRLQTEVVALTEEISKLRDNTTASKIKFNGVL